MSAAARARAGAAASEVRAAGAKPATRGTMAKGSVIVIKKDGCMFRRRFRRIRDMRRSFRSHGVPHFRAWPSDPRVRLVREETMSFGVACARGGVGQ